MTLALDIVRYAGEQHVRRGHCVDRPGEKRDITAHFVEMGVEPERIRSSIEAIAPECLCIARAVWWLTPFHPTKLKIYEDRIVLVRRFLWFKRWRRQERAFMIRHIREVESDFGILSASMIFRTHRSTEICCVRRLQKRDERKATRIIQALIRQEMQREGEKI